MPTYIKIVTFIENFLGQKLYNTHCIPLDNPKELVKGMAEFVDYCNKHVPSYLSAEVINGNGQTTTKK